MKTITFYSYKGGVGRTMALANIAWRLAVKGKRVGVLDLDLEAPGLSLAETFRVPSQAKGLSGYLAMSDRETKDDRAAYAEAMSQIVPSDARRQYGRTFGIGPFANWVVDEAFPNPGLVLFLSVGQAPLELRRFFAATSTDDGGRKVGSEPVSSVKAAFAEQECEYLLVDSRTGLCDTSQVAAVLFPDDIIMVVGLNEQNIRGTEEVLTVFKDYLSARVYVLPSLVPAGEEVGKKKAFDLMREMLRRRGLSSSCLLAEMALPYHPQLAVDERPMLVSGTGNYLARRYDELTEWIIGHNPADPRSKMIEARRILQSNAKDALYLIAPLSGTPPYRDEPEFLRLYAEVCLKAEKRVESRSVLSRLLALEAEQDKATGGPGMPSIDTILLLNDVDESSKASRDRRLPRLRSAVLKHRDSETKESLDRLFTATSEAYLEEPPDIPGFIAFNLVVADARPDFAHEAASLVAGIHAAHGQPASAHKAFEDVLAVLQHAREKDKATNHDMALLLWRWAELCGTLRDFVRAESLLQEALGLVDGEEKTAIYLTRASILSRQSDEPRLAEIKYLEQVLHTEPEVRVARVLRRLAQLYRIEGGQYRESALEMYRRLLRLEPWDRRDDILRIWRLQGELKWDFDPHDELEARAWLEEAPDDVYSLATVAEMVLLRGDRTESIRLLLDGAAKHETEREQVASAIGSYAQERWRDRHAVEDFVEALKSPVFADCPTALSALCRLYRITGNWPKALDAATKTADLATGARRSPFARLAIQILIRLCRWTEVLETVERESGFHRGDVTWPPAAADTYVVVGALQDDASASRRLFGRSLDILREFQDWTGPIQLDEILERRYRIMVERLGDPRGARADLSKVTEAVFPMRQDAAVRALPDAERALLLSARLWREAIAQTDNMARYAHDVDRWREMLSRKADLLFVTAQYERALEVLSRLGSDVVESNSALLFIKLRCSEALHNSVDAGKTLIRLRDMLKGASVESMKLTDLSAAIRCELRRTDGIEEAKARASDCVAWIETEDVDQTWRTAQSAAALYHLAVGDPVTGMEKVERLKRLGHYYDWVAEFLHDLSVIGSVHGLRVDLVEVRHQLAPLIEEALE